MDAESQGPSVEARRALYEAGIRRRLEQLPGVAQTGENIPAPTGTPLLLDPQRGRLPALIAPPAAASPSGAATNNNGSSTVRIEIDHSNAPDGTRMRASTQGEGAEIGSIRTRRAMPDAGAAAYMASG